MPGTSAAVAVAVLPFFVAASDATAAEKALATYQCDGTDDQVEINQAITDANATTYGFAKVLLSSGTFHCSAMVDSVGSITLEGMGGWSRATEIRVASPASFADTYLVSGVGIGELRGVYLANPARDGTEIHLLGGGSGVDALIENVVFDTNDAGGIYLPTNARRLIVTKCGFLNLGVGATRSAIVVGAATARGVVITDNVFDNTSGPYCIEVANLGAGAGAGVIAQNTAYNPSKGLSLSHSRDVTVTGNQWGKMLLDTCRSCAVVGNSVNVSSGHGIDMEDTQDCIVASNSVEGSGTDAIHIVSDAASSVQGNILRGAWTKGWTVDAACVNTMVLLNDGSGFGFTDAGTGTVLNLDGSANNWNRV